MYRHITAFTLAAILIGCTDADAPAPHAAQERPIQAPVPVDPRELEVAADRREVNDTLRAALSDPDPALRRNAARALARIHAPPEAMTLRRLLRDTDPEVRAWASLGLGALERDAPQDSPRALATALAAEPDPSTRASMVRDLGRLRSDEGVPAIAAALRSEHPVERAAGCLTAGDLGMAGRDLPPETRSRIAALLGSGEPLDVRRGCTFALSRLPPPADGTRAQAEGVALTMAAADTSPEVRALAYRALGRQPAVELEALVHGTADEDWQVAVQAFRALASRAARDGGPGAGVYARALERAYARAVQGGDVMAGGPLHVLLAALEAAAPMSRTGPVHELAARLHRELGIPGSDTPVTRDRGLAHCAAAELTDRGRGWPSRVDGCGLEQVPEHERRVRAAAVLGDLEGAEEQRVALLGRLLRDAQPVVRQAALIAAARVWHPDGTRLVTRALRDDDPGVLAAACEALATIARRVTSETRVPPPLDAAVALAALDAAADSLPDTELEALVNWLDAVEAVDARTLLERVQRLALHPSHAVRDRARAVLSGWQQPLPEGPTARPPNPIRAADLLSPEARPRVRLATDRGDIVIELRPDAAPATVARFLGLVRDGFYDGLTFHRVVPGFVVQGGDPRGDGYGGPGFWLRCEDNRLPYERGTVGMALAGRDTGGSQLFVTHSAQPHLDGRYTAFGLVVEGLVHVDDIQLGDRIRSAEVVSQ